MYAIRSYYGDCGLVACFNIRNIQLVDFHIDLHRIAALHREKRRTLLHRLPLFKRQPRYYAIRARTYAEAVDIGQYVVNIFLKALTLRQQRIQRSREYLAVKNKQFPAARYRITSYNVCYTKLLRGVDVFIEALRHWKLSYLCL